MGKFLLFLLKGTVVLLVTILVMALVFYVITVILDLSIWIAFGVIALLLGLFFLVYFVIYFIRRAHHKRFVEKIVAQDDILIQKSRSEENARITELRERWLKAVETLRHSSLRGRGNPLYVLPLFMLLGETNSGKSSSISHCGLSSIASEVGPIPGVSSTRNCDWWFFDKAIVIDTAGKYAVPIDGKIDEKEWKEFLIQVATYRKKEPINGIIVTLPADKLLNPDETVINKYGVYISEKINRIVMVVNARVPVYLLITKTDLISGFNSFKDALSPEELEQVCGYTSDLNESHLLVVDKAVSYVNECIFRLVLQQIPGMDNSQVILKNKSGLLLFANNIKGLQDRIRMFVQVAFGSDTYHEKVLFRGLYFCSSLQTGESSSVFASQYVGDQKVQSSAKSRGMFLKNLFHELLPRDRNLYEPIADFLRWRVISSNLALLSVCILCLAHILFLSYATTYCENKSEFFGSSINSIADSDTISEKRLGYFEELLKNVDETEQDFIYRYQPKFTRASLDTSMDVVRLFFVNKYRKVYFDKLMSLSFWQNPEPNTNSNGKTDEEQKAEMLGDSILFYAVLDRYFNAKVNGADSKELFAILQKMKLLNPRYLGCGDMSTDSCIYLMDNYLKYTEKYYPNKDISVTSHTNLMELLYSHHNFSWIVGWIDSKTIPVEASDYIPEGMSRKYKYDFSGAFTQDGYEYLKILFDMLPEAGFKKYLDLKKKVFMEYYVQNFYHKWTDFIVNFHLAINGIGMHDRVSMAPVMDNVDSNPFFNVYLRGEQELKFISQFNEKINNTYMDRSFMGIKYYKTLSDNSLADALIKKQAGNVSKIIGDLKKLGNKKNDDNDMENYATLTELNKKYFTTLSSMLMLYSTKPKAYQSFVNYATGEKGAEDYVSDLDKVMYDMEGVLEPKSPQAMTISGLIPYTQTKYYLQQLMNDLLSCMVQSEWENKVKLKLTDYSDNTADLFGEQGLVTNFVEKDIKYFITNTNSGYQGIDLNGYHVNFKLPFFNFLYLKNQYSKAYRIKDADIAVSTVPFEVNPDALKLPNSVEMNIYCKDKTITISNYNYSGKTKFNWAIGNCSKADIVVRFRDFSLRKTYNEESGIADLLGGFASRGTLVYTSSDFPNDAGVFNSINLKWLKLTFNVTGADEIIQSINFRNNDYGVPSYIAECPE